MKNKILIIISIVVLLIIVIWFSGIIPKQIGKIYAIQYMHKGTDLLCKEYDILGDFIDSYTELVVIEQKNIL